VINYYIPTRSIPSRVTQRTVIAFNQAIARQIRYMQ